jgi:hypothetical protein
MIALSSQNDKIQRTTDSITVLTAKNPEGKTRLAKRWVSLIEEPEPYSGAKWYTQRYQPHVYALAQGMRSRPQLYRAVTALVRLEDVSRERLDRLAHASNSPDLIRQLRRVYGIPVITTRTRKRRIADRDRMPGVYSLPPDMKSICRAALKLVAEGAVCL